MAYDHKAQLQLPDSGGILFEPEPILGWTRAHVTYRRSTRNTLKCFPCVIRRLATVGCRNKNRPLHNLYQGGNQLYQWCDSLMFTK